MGNTLTVQERNAMFAQATRQNYQGLGKKSVNTGASTLSFILPKARLMSKILLDIDMKFKLKHDDSSTFETDESTPYRPIRRISLDLNNGFAPFVIGGRELQVYNGIRQYGHIIKPQSEDITGYCYCPTEFATSPEGVEHFMHTTVELANTLNDRDPVGLILTQNNETNIELKIDFESESEMLGAMDGYRLEVVEFSVKPTIESFSIPAIANAMPDLSVIKLVNSRTEAFTGAGQNLINLATGTIYRKLAFIVEDETGSPFVDEDFTSNIDLVFNQADVNYSIPAEMLRHINEAQFGCPMPKGVYVFDFSYNGVSNYGGTRDYIDTEMLTMFQVRFNSKKAGRVRIVSECLARLV